MRKILLNVFQHRKDLVNAIKDKAEEHGFDEQWALNNWWIEDLPKRDYLMIRIGKPSDDVRVATISIEGITKL